MSRKVIRNTRLRLLLPTELLKRYDAISMQCGRTLATTLRNVLAATIEEAEAAGRKLYKFNREENDFDELAGQTDEDDADGVEVEREAGASSGTEASVGGGAEHSAESEEEDTEVRDGGGVDDPATEAGGRPASHGRKSKKGR
jgi:hypothetical protein